MNKVVKAWMCDKCEVTLGKKPKMPCLTTEPRKYCSHKDKWKAGRFIPETDYRKLMKVVRAVEGRHGANPDYCACPICKALAALRRGKK